MTLLWIDDIRNPFLNVENKVPNCESIHWVLNYSQFILYIEKLGLPDVISFDHDLADIDDKSGYDCAKYLVDYCMDNNKRLPSFRVHSANPVGKENIEYLLNNFKRFNE